MKVQECPYTNQILEELKTTNDNKEKAKLIASIKSLICGSSTDRTVCCDVDILDSIFSQHSDTNPSLPCGVGPTSRGQALGFRNVADGGSDAKILDVSSYLIR